MRPICHHHNLPATKRCIPNKRRFAIFSKHGDGDFKCKQTLRKQVKYSSMHCVNILSRTIKRTNTHTDGIEWLSPRLTLHPHSSLCVLFLWCGVCHSVYVPQIRFPSCKPLYCVRTVHMYKRMIHLHRRQTLIASVTTSTPLFNVN